MRKLTNWLCLTAVVVALGCASSPQTTTYKTIAALQSAVDTAHKAYHYWAVRYAAANPQSAKLLALDGRVSNALDVWKSTALVTLSTLTTNDVPTVQLQEAGLALLNAIKGTNGL